MLSLNNVTVAPLKKVVESEAYSVPSSEVGCYAQEFSRRAQPERSINTWRRFSGVQSSRVIGRVIITLQSTTHLTNMSLERQVRAKVSSLIITSVKYILSTISG